MMPVLSRSRISLPEPRSAPDITVPSARSSQFRVKRYNRFLASLASTIIFAYADRSSGVFLAWRDFDAPLWCWLYVFSVIDSLIRNPKAAWGIQIALGFIFQDVWRRSRPQSDRGRGLLGISDRGTSLPCSSQGCGHDASHGHSSHSACEMRGPYAMPGRCRHRRDMPPA